jgi:hypothetical protein
MSEKIVSQWSSYPDQRASLRLGAFGAAFAIAIILALSIIPSSHVNERIADTQNVSGYAAQDRP